ncbi:MAG: YCF48-related protein, partial [Tumebacillaceae bacterium]
MKTSRWFSSLTVLFFCAALVLAGCSKSVSTPQDPGATQGQGSSATPDNPTGDTPPSATQPPIDTVHNQYEGSSIAFQSPSNGWIGGQGFILHTTDGGAHWSMQYQGPYQITDLSLPDATNGFALGQLQQSSGQQKYALLSTTDGGLHWKEVSNPTNVLADPNGIGELHFTSATEGTLGDLMTTDGGKTWQTLPVPSGSHFNPVYLDRTNGWLFYSSNNTASQIRIQRTTDGGKSWTDTMTKATQSPSAGGQLKVSSPNDVWALIYGGTGMTQTSYSLFHTTDGGADWQTVLANSTAGGGPAPGVDPSTVDASKQGPKTKPGDLEVVDA